MTLEDSQIRLDRMRYVKNTASSRLCYLAILINVLYFVSIYKSDVASWYYQILVGASIVYNLLFMLTVFLASEGVKNYQKKYSNVLFALGALQVARIFILPLRAHAAVVTINQQETAVMQNAQFLRVVAYLAASAVCCFVAGLVGIRKSRALANHMASLEQKVA